MSRHGCQELVASESFAVARPLLGRRPEHDQGEVAGELFAVNHAQIVVATRSTTQLVATSPMTALKVRVQHLERKCQRQQKRIDQLVVVSRDARADAVATQPMRSHQCQVVALLRNLHSSSCAAAADWCSVLTRHSLHAMTVARHELACGASIIAAAQGFHADLEQAFFDNRDHSHDSSGGWDFVISDLAGDATRSNAWRGNKVQCLCLRSTFCIADKLQCKVFWPDLLVVDDSTAVGCHKLVLKQCRVVQSAALDASVCACVGKHQIRWLHICGDCGPDQVGFRLDRARAFRLFTYGLVTGAPCLAHQDHLAASTVLGMIDRVLKLWGVQWCFFSVLVKLCHLLRNECELVTRCAVNRWGSLSEQARLARRKAPQCIGGRWLSVSESESYVLAFDHDDFQAMLADAFFSTPDDASQLVAATTCPHDELKLDAIKAHKEKITKYRRDVKAAATHMLFFCDSETFACRKRSVRPFPLFLAIEIG